MWRAHIRNDEWHSNLDGPQGTDTNYSPCEGSNITGPTTSHERSVFSLSKSWCDSLNESIGHGEGAKTVKLR
jgi:hypothetical protein